MQSNFYFFVVLTDPSTLATLVGDLAPVVDEPDTDTMATAADEHETRLFVAEWIANSKMKQLSLEADLATAVADWEQHHGQVCVRVCFFFFFFFLLFGI